MRAGAKGAIPGVQGKRTPDFEGLREALVGRASQWALCFAATLAAFFGVIPTSNALAHYPDEQAVPEWFGETVTYKGISPTCEDARYSLSDGVQFVYTEYTLVTTCDASVPAAGFLHCTAKRTHWHVRQSGQAEQPDRMDVDVSCRVHISDEDDLDPECTRTYSLDRPDQGQTAGQVTVTDTGWQPYDCRDDALTVKCTRSGTDRDDALRGTKSRDILCGFAGDDRLEGQGAMDFLRGDEGNDILMGGFDRDTLDGGLGQDVLSDGVGANHFAPGPGDDTVFARNSIPETIECGEGWDVAQIDRRDDVSDCEGTFQSALVEQVDAKNRASNRATKQKGHFDPERVGNNADFAKMRLTPATGGKKPRPSFDSTTLETCWDPPFRWKVNETVVWQGITKSKLVMKSVTWEYFTNGPGTVAAGPTTIYGDGVDGEWITANDGGNAGKHYQSFKKGEGWRRVGKHRLPVNRTFSSEDDNQLDAIVTHRVGPAEGLTSDSAEPGAGGFNLCVGGQTTHGYYVPLG
jgi:hypothetical protein